MYFPRIFKILPPLPHQHLAAMVVQKIASQQGWEFIKEKKKVRKQENTHASTQTRTRPRKKNSLKKTRTRTRKRPRKKELGQCRVER